MLEHKIFDNLRPYAENEGGGKGRRRAYGMRSARLCRDIIEVGTPLKHVGPIIMKVIHASTDVQLDVKGGKTKFTSKTVKELAIGASNLDTEELIKSILLAPHLVIAGDESPRKGDKKFPIFVAFWNVVVGAPWWGMLRVCSMKDKTAKTQAELFYDTIVEVLGYPRDRVMYVLSDNTASVSAKNGGCVTLLQRKLRGEDITAVVRELGGGGARGRGSGGARGRGSEGARGRGRRGARGRGRGGRAGTERGGGGGVDGARDGIVGSDAIG